MQGRETVRRRGDGDRDADPVAGALEGVEPGIAQAERQAPGGWWSARASYLMAGEGVIGARLG